MTLRTWMLVLVGAIVGATVSLVYAISFDPVCVPAPEVYGGVCSHDERSIFGWQPGSLAVPSWTTIGIVGGGLVGLLAARATQRT